MNIFDLNRTGTGTKEWSDYSYNITMGCEHDCLYCYAKGMRARFDKSMRTPGRWSKLALNPKSKLGADVGRKGVVMFPTSHDITPEFLKESIITIKNLLRHNRVLIVSKPHLAVVKELCKELVDHRGDILFRFTIGSLQAATCAFWEPGAPPPSERIKALKHAFDHGFQTSASIEPMLEDRHGTIALVNTIEPYVTNTIWVGKMQRIPRKYNSHIKGLAEAAATIKAQQSDPEILQLVQALRGKPKIRWKDSIAAIIEKHRVNPQV